MGHCWVSFTGNFLGVELNESEWLRFFWSILGRITLSKYLFGFLLQQAVFSVIYCKQSIPSFQHRISIIFFFCQVLSCFLMVSFLFRKSFRGNINEAISLAKIDVTLKVTSISTNEITSCSFSGMMSLTWRHHLTSKQGKLLALSLCD